MQNCHGQCAEAELRYISFFLAFSHTFLLSVSSHSSLLQGEICLLKSHLNFGSQVYTRHRLALTKWLLDLSPLQAPLHEQAMYNIHFLSQ